MTLPAAPTSAEAPRVLLLATGRWISTARMALALDLLGCQVYLMCPGGHPARDLRALRATYRFQPLRPLESIRSAISQSQPATIIPVDELAVLHAEELYAKDENLRPLITRSLGGPQVLSAARSRIEILKIAQAASVPIPLTRSIHDESDLAPAAEWLGLPMVLKADATSGGRGVRLVDSVADALTTWKELHEPPGFLRAAWRGVHWQEWSHLRTWARRQRRGVIAQSVVHGGENTAMAVAHEGELLAIVCLEVVETWSLRGPSSVLRIIESEPMERAARAVIRGLRLSGFCGFDFMRGENDEPLLIEMNPRPTQVAHLPLGPGRDLVAAYVRRVLGVEAADRPSATEGDLIALFPQELQRDANSSYVGAAYHDVPWDQPALIRRVLSPLSPVITNDPRWRNE